MKLIATKDFNYQGRALKVGDQFESATDEDARLLIGFEKAKKGRREYVRRDMKAES